MEEQEEELKRSLLTGEYWTCLVCMETAREDPVYSTACECVAIYCRGCVRTLRKCPTCRAPVHPMQWAPIHCVRALLKELCWEKCGECGDIVKKNDHRCRHPRRAHDHFERILKDLEHKDAEWPKLLEIFPLAAAFPRFDLDTFWFGKTKQLLDLVLDNQPGDVEIQRLVRSWFGMGTSWYAHEVQEYFCQKLVAHFETLFALDHLRALLGKSWRAPSKAETWAIEDAFETFGDRAGQARSILSAFPGVDPRRWNRSVSSFLGPLEAQKFAQAIHWVLIRFCSSSSSFSQNENDSKNDENENDERKRRTRRGVEIADNATWLLAKLVVSLTPIAVKLQGLRFQRVLTKACTIETEIESERLALKDFCDPDFKRIPSLMTKLFSHSHLSRRSHSSSVFNCVVLPQSVLRKSRGCLGASRWVPAATTPHLAALQPHFRSKKNQKHLEWSWRLGVVELELDFEPFFGESKDTSSKVLKVRCTPMMALILLVLDDEGCATLEQLKSLLPIEFPKLLDQSLQALCQSRLVCQGRKMFSLAKTFPLTSKTIDLSSRVARRFSFF